MADNGDVLPEQQGSLICVCGLLESAATRAAAPRCKSRESREKLVGPGGGAEMSSRWDCQGEEFPWLGTHWRPLLPNSSSGLSSHCLLQLIGSEGDLFFPSPPQERGFCCCFLIKVALISNTTCQVFCIIVRYPYTLIAYSSPKVLASFLRRIHADSRKPWSVNL